jgi:hypothetical protein
VVNQESILGSDPTHVTVVMDTTNMAPAILFLTEATLGDLLIVSRVKVDFVIQLPYPEAPLANVKTNPES